MFAFSFLSARFFQELQPNVPRTYRATKRKKFRSEFVDHNQSPLPLTDDPLLAVFGRGHFHVLYNSAESMACGVSTSADKSAWTITKSKCRGERRESAWPVKALAAWGAPVVADRRRLW